MNFELVIHYSHRETGKLELPSIVTVVDPKTELAPRMEETLDAFDQKALLTAVKLNKPLICEYLVGLGRATMPKNFLDHEDPVGWTPLRYSARAGHEAIVKVLLENGAGVDVADLDGRTALRAACFGGHEKTVEVLIKHAADGKLHLFSLL